MAEAVLQGENLLLQKQVVAEAEAAVGKEVAGAESISQAERANLLAGERPDELV